jgi:tRNA (guanine-N7-)-methyltransferase
VAKNKLSKFKDNEVFENVIQISYSDIESTNFEFHNRWSDIFGNTNPIVLELGCGKGEYTTGQAKLFPNKNFVGIDVKGARIWRGAKTSLDNQFNNVRFVRSRINQLHKIFGKNDNISEVWITFPDPQPRESKAKKRLSGPEMVEVYQSFLQSNHSINLKTDSKELYDYTKEWLLEKQQEILIDTSDLYSENWVDEVLSIKTTYENIWLSEGKKICYLKFKVKL